MIRRMRVVRGQPIEDWLAAPQRDRRRADTTRAQFVRAVHVIEQMGTLAGDGFLKKLPGYESLWETPVGDRRVFSTIVGNAVLMAVVVEKKKQRLSAGKLRAIDIQVQRFAETWREEDNSDRDR